MDEYQIYTDKRISKLDSIKHKLQQTDSEKEAFELKYELFNEYLSFQTDSALHYATERLKSAYIIGEQEYIDAAILNISYVFIIAGMYKEASDMLKNIKRNTLKKNLEGYYFNVYNSLYESMFKYSIARQYREKYRKIAIAYNDSMLLINNQNTFVYADQLLKKGNLEEGLQVLLNEYHKLSANSKPIAYVAYAISECYRQMNNTEKEKEYLIISAIADLRWGIKEYISLWRLAIILYKEGDIGRAYNYIRRSQADASFCNARLRTIELTQSLPIIEKAYRLQTEKEHKNTQLALIGVSVLTLLLIILVMYIHKQMNRISRTKRLLDTANFDLKKLNQDLYNMNQQLTKTLKDLHETNHELSFTNQSLVKANQIKEVYITNFITECFAYIDKMDNFRKQLNKLAINGNMDLLLKNLKSPLLIEKELENFYHTFDKSFLHLFPCFIEQFNQLLQPDEIITIKKNGDLTTELRIFALLRLGISNNEKIATFLHCSKSTIYVYRSKLRLRSLSPDTFEKDVMNIT